MMLLAVLQLNFREHSENFIYTDIFVKGKHEL